MDLGFETIGNATVICYDQGPVLATDPWLMGCAYFGSWTFSHTIPDEQMEAVRACRYLWISHGHPDHLSIETLNILKDKTLLLPDHVGGRITRDLRREGFNVVVLKDATWTSLSPRIHVLSIADYNQDGALLIDVGGTLIVNLNDGRACGWELFLKSTIRRYRRSFLLMLFGRGDADMINFVDESGKRLETLAMEKYPIGPCIQELAEELGVNNVIPFSSFHRYQRSDSAWVNEYGVGVNDYKVGFTSSTCVLHPPFVSYNCASDDVREINPNESPSVIVDPKAFGDDWNEPLSARDRDIIRAYFRSLKHLDRVLDFINVRVGGQDNLIEFAGTGRRHKNGIRFDAPRHSFVQAIKHECFDDLLIGNFMRTCVIGKWPASTSSALYPDFTPYVAKYGDNGRAKSAERTQAVFSRVSKTSAPF